MKDVVRKEDACMKDAVRKDHELDMYFPACVRTSEMAQCRSTLLSQGGRMHLSEMFAP